MALSRKPIEIVDEGNHQLLTKADHWERVPLLDVAMVQNGFAFKSELFTHSEGKPLIRIRDIEDGWTENFYSGEYSDEFVVRKGDILIGMDGDFNAAIWQGAEGLLNQRVCRLIPCTKNFSAKFLFLCLQPFLNAINAETSSVTVKHLSSRTIGEIPLPLPPLNEQHRIVAKMEELFSELDKGIENLKTAQAQLKVCRQALLKHAFEGRLTAQWRAENQDKLETADALQKRIQQERAQRYQQQLADWEATGKQGSKPKAPKLLPPLTAKELAELPDLPEGWLWARLGEVFVDSPKNGIYKSADNYGSGFSIIRIDDFYDGSLIRTSGFKKVNLSAGEIETFTAHVGDILINRVNSIEYLGKCCEIRGLTEPVVFESNIMKTTLAANFVSNYFVTSYLASYFGRRRLCANAKHAVNQASINQTDVSLTPIPLAQLGEQVTIAEHLGAHLSEIDQLNQTITTSLQQAEALRQSILKKAFSGQLVPQDPHDEPATVLLARIRAEQESVVTPKRTRKSV